MLLILMLFCVGLSLLHWIAICQNVLSLQVATLRPLFYFLPIFQKQCSIPELFLDFAAPECKLCADIKFVAICFVFRDPPIDVNVDDVYTAVIMTKSLWKLTQQWKQFFQVGLLDLIGPSSQSFMHLCIFGLYGAMWVFFKNYTYFTLPCRGLGLVRLALYLLDWPTVVLQCLTLLVGSSDP